MTINEAKMEVISISNTYDQQIRLINLVDKIYMNKSTEEKTIKLDKKQLDKLLKGNAINSSQCKLIGTTWNFITKNKGWKNSTFFILESDIYKFTALNGVAGIKNQKRVLNDI